MWALLNENGSVVRLIHDDLAQKIKEFCVFEKGYFKNEMVLTKELRNLKLVKSTNFKYGKKYRVQRYLMNTHSRNRYYIDYQGVLYFDLKFQKAPALIYKHTIDEICGDVVFYSNFDKRKIYYFYFKPTGKTYCNYNQEELEQLYYVVKNEYTILNTLSKASKNTKIKVFNHLYNELKPTISFNL